ncbi:MAG TPA: type II toxin-antitoxin system VapB family antitoxin [Rhizomicrobium sp.]|nr:type II toxin-antitoxin system VapB family antitoxin [Rhizomicrobium sp.]
MALSIKTEEADRLARELSRLTGESMTEVVTKSLRQRLEREKKSRPKKRTKKQVQEEVSRMNAFMARIRRKYDFSRLPADKAYFDALWGEDEIMAAMKR